MQLKQPKYSCFASLWVYVYGSIFRRSTLSSPKRWFGINCCRSNDVERWWPVSGWLPFTTCPGKTRHDHTSGYFCASQSVSLNEMMRKGGNGIGEILWKYINVYHLSGIEHLTCSWMGTSGTGSKLKDIPLKTEWLMTCLYVLNH